MSQYPGCHNKEPSTPLQKTNSLLSALNIRNYFEIIRNMAGGEVSQGVTEGG